MNSVKHILLILLLGALAACQPSVQKMGTPVLNEGSLFIIGGGSRPESMVKRMISESGTDTSGYIVILPMSSAEPDSAIIWSGEQFRLQGVTRVFGFNFLPGETPPSHWLDSLERASLIYISGGNQSRFMEIVGDGPIRDAIFKAYKNGAMIAGTSAGAAVMSEKMITGNELRNPDYNATFRTIESENIETLPGLGLIQTALIDQHFVWRSRHNRLISGVIEFPDLLGIGIDESTAILVRGDTAEVVGVSQVLVFSNPGRSRKDFEYKLGAEKLNLDVYLPGDRFAIN